MHDDLDRSTRDSDSPAYVYSLSKDHPWQIMEVARRLYVHSTEHHMSGDDMRDAANTLMVAVNFALELDEGGHRR